MATPTYPPDATVSALFRAWIAGDPARREQLLAAGMLPGYIDGIADGRLSDRVLFMHAKTIERLSGLDLRQIMFLEAKREVWGGEDRLTSIRTFDDLMAALADIVARCGPTALARRIGVTDLRTFKRWREYTRRPERAQIVSVLRTVEAYRTGSWSAPPAPAASRAADTSSLDALRAAHRRKPAQYSYSEIGRKLGRPRATVRDWIVGRRRPDQGTLDRIRQVFPELFGGEPAASAAAPGQAPAPHAEPAAVGLALDGGRRRQAIGSCVSVLSSAIDLFAQVTADDPDAILDGDRANVLRLVRRLAAATGITEESLERLTRSQPLTRDDLALLTGAGVVGRASPHGKGR